MCSVCLSTPCLTGCPNAEEQEPSGGTFYIRLVIGILCFVCFVYMDQSKAEIAQVNSVAIVNQIEKDVDTDAIVEAWKSL